jgi:hypothetical protein
LLRDALPLIGSLMVVASEASCVVPRQCMSPSRVHVLIWMACGVGQTRLKRISRLWGGLFQSTIRDILQFGKKLCESAHVASRFHASDAAKRRPHSEFPDDNWLVIVCDESLELTPEIWWFKR